MSNRNPIDQSTLAMQILNSEAPAPNGLDWLSDTLNGVDIYSCFAKTPTIFFDPQSTATKSQGTYKYPYKTQAELQVVIAGHMAGQVLGFKRGSVLRVTGAFGLSISVYGTTAKPFVICPYDDANALPIITAGANVTWILFDAGNNIWSYTAAEVDVWRSNARQKKKAFSTSVIETLDSSSNNRTTYTGGKIYLRLPAGETPNDGTVEVSASSYAFDLNYSNVPATGNIIVCGLDVQKGSNNTFSITPESPGNLINTIDNIQVIGCRASSSGIDNNAILGRDAMCIYGLNNDKRITNLYVAGCYCTDSLNHALELGGTSGAIVEKNMSYDCGGNSIIELWTSCDNAIIRYNWGDYSGTTGNIAIQAGGGIFFANRELNGDTDDTTNTKNFNNTAYFNLITRPRIKGFMANGGIGHKFYQNTVYFDSDSTGSSGTGWLTTGTAATGFCNISNNLFYWNPGIKANWYPNMVLMQAPGANASIPSGDYNVYFTWWGTAKSLWNAKGGTPFAGSNTTSSLIIYKTAMAAYSLDQNSLASIKNAGGTLTLSSIGLVVPTILPAVGVYHYAPDNAFVPMASAVPGIRTLTGIGKKYFDDKPYAATSATIGAFLGA